MSVTNNQSDMGGIATEILNHFDLPSEIKNIQGMFKYRFFEPTEQIDEENLFGQGEGNADPRYIKLTWQGEQDLVDSEGFRDLLEHRKNLFFPSDLNTGFSILQSTEETISQRQDAVVSDASVGSKLDYLLTTVNSNKFTEAIEENITNPNSGADKNRIPVLDQTTGMPIQSTSVLTNSSQPPDIYIKSSYVGQILKASNMSPINLNSLQPLQDLANSIEASNNEKEQQRQGRRLLTTLSYAIDSLAMQGAVKDAFRNNSKDQSEIPGLLSLPRKSPTYLQNWGLIGYTLSKYRVQNTQETYMYTRMVFDRFFRDPHVAYGRTYKYEIRPIFAKYANDMKDQLVILGSDESSSITISCEEIRAPAPPRNLNFEYVLNNNIRIEWHRPESYVEDEGQSWDTDDIKGYQIFVRNSLIEPYRLVRYFTFNNTFPQRAVMYSKELISDDFIISSEYELPDSIDITKIPNFYEFNEYTINIRPNTDYFFAMCSIDAHGNSSNYSAQYKVRRDNVTGEVDIQLACPAGAPKQYPNILIPGKLAYPSFRSSGFRYMDIHLAPDSQQSVPNLNEPAVNLQLFELETQIEKNIVITIKENE